MGATEKYFLAYQQRWLADTSRIKIWEKSRRIGATYVQAYEDVRDAATDIEKVYFSSADDSAAAEYIDYCRHWAKVLNIVATYLGEVLLDEEKDVLARKISFANGHCINAMSSNPKRFRSKGGKIILDEFAWHDNQRGMWAAARPAITWGYPLRILSTYNGKGNLYHQFVEQTRRKELDWSLHATPIQVAVAEGLADRILGRPLTPEERAAWLESERLSVADDDTWRQEYCCDPIDEATALLTYDCINACACDGLETPLDDTTGDLYLGVDIGRKKDLTVMWILERTGPALTTRLVKVLSKTKFARQRSQLYEFLRHPRLRRCCMDATGLGMQLAEEAREAFGGYRVEPCTFTPAVREELAYGLCAAMEDRKLWIPAHKDIREDLHSVRKIVTSAGNVRLDVNASANVDSHADRFWALALAVHAADTAKGKVHVVSGLARLTRKILGSL